MSSGSGGKPEGGTQPGRPAADTPQRLVVRSLDPDSDSKVLAANDTAVAVGSQPTPSDGQTAQTAQTAMSDTSASGAPATDD